MFNFLKKDVKAEKVHHPKVFIFMGRSGCGKGTQADFIVKHLCEVEKFCKTLHVETGALLRVFIKGNTYTEKLTKKVVESGGLMPEAIVVGIWSNYLFSNFSGKENIVFDGCPRKLHEALLLDSALRFYGIDKPTVIYINVSEKWAEDRLTARARKDDSSEGIKKRMEWFGKEVVPTIDFFRNSPNFRFFEVNGEKTVEEVHQDIKAKVF
jgi:adenylate kinase